MNTIHKYQLGPPGQLIQLDLPKGAEIVAVGQQPNAGYVIWAKVDTDLPSERRSFAVYGTGWDIPANAKYKGVLFEGPFVWHVCELP